VVKFSWWQAQTGGSPTEKPWVSPGGERSEGGLALWLAKHLWGSPKASQRWSNAGLWKSTGVQAQQGKSHGFLKSGEQSPEVSNPWRPNHRIKQQRKVVG
jgi:hypothetical protein